jgi:hypothetical protein
MGSCAGTGVISVLDSCSIFMESTTGMCVPLDRNKGKHPTCFEQRGIAQRKTPTPKVDTVLFPVEVRFESLVLFGAIELLR